MTNAYEREALGFARLAMAAWNREASSPSFGCFDRQYWGWKKKDMADATLQAAVALCVRLAEREGAGPALVPWLDGFVAYLEATQHRNGSFDQIYPHERAPGVVYDMLGPLLFAMGRPYVSKTTAARLEAVLRRGIAYAVTAEEDHGEIANHFANYAWELINAGRILGDERATARGRGYLERTLKLQHAQEGWFYEYDGADAGYQTRNLAFLTRIAEVTGDEVLWAACEKGARFVERALMPDDALHPMFGVRGTALIYASAFERLAVRNPNFVELAERIHSGWQSGATPVPSCLDFENGVRIAEDAFDAAEIRSARAGAAPPSPTFEAYDLDEAGLHRRIVPIGADGVVLAIASSLGGIAATYVRDRAGTWRLADEDSGYLLTLTDGSRWTSRRAGAGRIVARDESSMTITTTFERALHDELTPLRMILLRTLNLTVLRSQSIGDLFKRIVVRRLISARESLSVTLTRRIAWGTEGVTVEDWFAADPPVSGRLAGASLQRCRRVIGNHMASSRYFQPAELTLRRPWTEEIGLEALSGKAVTTALAVRP